MYVFLQKSACTLCRRHSLKLSRYLSSKAKRRDESVRNIGVMAHIDAGKTTTTERMLYFSGVIPSMGEVHDGNTVTDYLAQERSRGITITSAFVKLAWRDHTFNIVDTPGHIDFTMEVEHALNVIDSSVIILDSSAGVEAQTVTVWKQLSSKQLPCLVYVNKMDRKDSDLSMSVESLRVKLGCVPVLLHQPVFDRGVFTGVIDVASFHEYIWSKSNKVPRKNTVDKEHKHFKSAFESRMALIDLISNYDDDVAHQIIERGSLESISSEEIITALRRLSISRKCVPVVCGSSYKNIGVQSLMDGIIDYMPSPSEAYLTGAFTGLKEQFLAKAFKVVHSKHKGPITFLRLYSGTLKKGDRIYNGHREKSESTGQVLVPFADDFEEIPSAKSGEYMAVTGFKATYPGDILFNSATSVKKVKSQLADLLKRSEEETEDLLQLEHNVPEPVFFCSIESSSAVHQQTVEKALEELQREDPSLKVTFDAESGQTVLAGMGELHLEIIKERIKTEYKVDVELGPLQIVYKEELLDEGKDSHCLTSHIGPKEETVGITLSLKPGFEKELLILDLSAESAPNTSKIHHKQLKAIKRGIVNALSKGPTLSSQVINVHAVLHWLDAKKFATESLLTAVASQCVEKVLNSKRTTLMEPIMNVVVTSSDAHGPAITSDLSRRRANIVNIQGDGISKEIECQVPLSELLGYAKHLRIMTSGTATLSMSFCGYQELVGDRLEEIQSCYSFRPRLR